MLADLKNEQSEKNKNSICIYWVMTLAARR
mgnify:CR=1 FL=1